MSDHIFYTAMLDLGIRKMKAWAMYESVRAFGSMPWNKGDVTPFLQYVMVTSSAGTGISDYGN